MDYNLDSDFFQWIDAHMSDNPARLRLKYGHSRANEILQIECRRKYATKLGAAFKADPQFIFPTALSGEQSTSCRLADFHASMIGKGWRVADLTAGLGIDAMAMARHTGSQGFVLAVERDDTVADALRHNARTIDNLEVAGSDCRTLLDVWAAEGMQFDCMFIDPARRDNAGGRVYALDQCEPDVVAMLPLLRAVTKRLIIKASPMLDISHTLSLLPEAVKVTVLGTPTECKELDITCEFGRNTYHEPLIEAVTIGQNVDSRFTFTRSEEATATVNYGIPQPGDYILEPYPPVMKAAPYRLLAERFGLSKPSANTQLWYGRSIPAGFPGRAFEVEETQPFMSKNIKRYSSRYPRICVTTRNFDISAVVLRAKLGVKDGPGRMFAITGSANDKYLITCKE